MFIAWLQIVVSSTSPVLRSCHSSWQIDAALHLSAALNAFFES
jgi:hypothetical protein